ncbi:MAG: YggS family pyridoxal phosphate-dependent enzyme [Bacteroidales bacterium]|jgi:pyridoxal phosphate enzyme (YggS family)|nr:YggS family pyridoxal phosphate-dependent enzyme [Bacteroidales bacterium]
MSVSENLSDIKRKIPPHVRLVAVSKTKPVSDVMEAYAAGHRIFGENKAQELITKQPELPDDIEWHFIGHLQRNKVKYMAQFVEMIESVDSLKLLKEINKQAVKFGRTINCLLQFHIASEETKFGLDLGEAEEILDSEDYRVMENIRLCGVMGMATFTTDELILRKEFSSLRMLFTTLKEKYFQQDESFREISMGMSGDYMIAIEEGSTNVRVGTAIFGARTYSNQ